MYSFLGKAKHAPAYVADVDGHSTTDQFNFSLSSSEVNELSVSELGVNELSVSKLEVNKL